MHFALTVWVLSVGASATAVLVAAGACCIVGVIVSRIVRHDDIEQVFRAWRVQRVLCVAAAIVLFVICTIIQVCIRGGSTGGAPMVLGRSLMCSSAMSFLYAGQALLLSFWLHRILRRHQRTGDVVADVSLRRRIRRAVRAWCWFHRILARIEGTSLREMLHKTTGPASERDKGEDTGERP